MDYSDLNRTLVHELVHAVDSCRLKADWSDVKQHACTEIRASSLSSECSFGVEMARGNIQMRGGWEACVKRRAKMSVGMHGIKEAEQAVEDVFDRCSRDTYPFMRHPGAV